MKRLVALRAPLLLLLFVPLASADFTAVEDDALTWSSQTWHDTGVTGICNVGTSINDMLVMYQRSGDGNIYIRRHSEDFAIEYTMFSGTRNATGASCGHMEYIGQGTFVAFALYGGLQAKTWTTVTTDDGETWSTPVWSHADFTNYNCHFDLEAYSTTTFQLYDSCARRDTTPFYPLRRSTDAGSTWQNIGDCGFFGNPAQPNQWLLGPLSERGEVYWFSGTPTVNLRHFTQCGQTITGGPGDTTVFNAGVFSLPNGGGFVCETFYERDFIICQENFNGRRYLIEIGPYSVDQIFDGGGLVRSYASHDPSMALYAINSLSGTDDKVVWSTNAVNWSFSSITSNVETGASLSASLFQNKFYVFSTSGSYDLSSELPAAATEELEPSEFDAGLKQFVINLGFQTPESQMFFTLILVAIFTIVSGIALKMASPGRIKTIVVSSFGVLAAVFTVLLLMLDLWMFVVALVLFGVIMSGATEFRNTISEIRGEIAARRSGVIASPDRFVDPDDLEDGGEEETPETPPVPPEPSREPKEPALPPPEAPAILGPPPEASPISRPPRGAIEAEGTFKNGSGGGD